MEIILLRDWSVTDYKTSEESTIQPGMYQMERVRISDDPSVPPWLVLKGTSIGRNEISWRQWCGKDAGDSQVQIIE